MEPLPEGEANALTGMNVAYDREAIAAIEDLLRKGRWEGWLHARLQERGIGLTAPPGWCSSTTRTSASASSSRSGGTTRAPTPACGGTLGRRRWLYALAAPLLPPVLYWRMARNARGRRRREFDRDAAHPPLPRGGAAGEAVGMRWRRAEPARGALTHAGGRGRDELGEPSRLRPVRAQRRRQARGGGEDEYVLFTDDRTAREEELPQGAIVRAVSLGRPPGVDSPRSLRDLARVACGLTRASRRVSLPSVYTWFPVRGSTSSASTTSSPSSTPS